MAGPNFIGYDPTQDVGSRFAPEVIAEIEAVAPSTVTNGSVSTSKIADEAVTTGKLAPGAVDTTIIATGGVETVNLGEESVATDKIEDGAVTPVKCGTGVVVAKDHTGTVVGNTDVFLTAAQYGAIGSPDPNTTYYVSS